MPTEQRVTQDGGEDPEVAAISTLVGVLAPLQQAARERVVAYVFARLGIGAAAPPPAPPALSPPGAPGTQTPPADKQIADIRSLKNRAQPRNSIEMAAVVAYYLTEIASGDEKKGEITSEDIEKYFKQADFPLPDRAIKTLFDAKNAGYLDAGSGRGTYRLNPVGHNLVAHGLPSKGGEARPAKRKHSKKRKK